MTQFLTTLTVMLAIAGALYLAADRADRYYAAVQQENDV